MYFIFPSNGNYRRIILHYIALLTVLYTLIFWPFLSLISEEHIAYYLGHSVYQLTWGVTVTVSDFFDIIFNNPLGM